MRISDWSSDVCSSDLRAIKIQEKGGSIQQAMRWSGEHWCSLFNHGLYLGRHAARWQGRVVRQSALPPRQAATRLLFRPAMSDFTDPFDQIVEAPFEIGRANVCTPVTNAHLVCRLLLEQKNKLHTY